MRNGLYVMTVTHQRLRPQRHALRARITTLLLDIDDVGAVARACRLFSVGRRNLVSFHPTDHGDGATADLRGWFGGCCRSAGIEPPRGRLFLLAMPRLLGRAFNPLAVFFAFHEEGDLGAILYEVRNTFGGRHAYVVPVGPGATLRHSADKRFHVSPFMPADMTYRFNVTLPRAGLRGEVLRVRIDGEDRLSGARLIATAMSGRAAPISDRGLLAAALRMPLQGLRVLAEIHLEAVRLWWKGARLRPTPAGAAQRSVSAGC